MSLTTRACLVAEGAAPDRRGFFTLVAVEPQVWEVPAFPFNVAPLLYIVVDDDEEPPVLAPGQNMDFTCRATGPAEQTLFFAQQSAPVQPKSVQDLPYRVQIALQVPITVSEEGTYLLSATMAIEGVELNWERNIFVRVSTPGAAAQQPPLT